MKRALRLLPTEIEKIDQILPYRLSEEDLLKLKTTIAGYEFLLIGGTLVCPTCGQPQQLISQVAEDREVYFFLKFFCTHYGKDSVKVGQVVDTTTPAA